MSNLYLIRHGQAGTRHHYDTLSDLGRMQARLLGEHLAAQGIEFAAAYSGGLERQRQTGAAVADAYAAAGRGFPDAEVHDAWREFDLDHVVRAMAPQLSAADPEFRREFEELRRQAADHSGEIHRRWTSCDVKIIEAWLHEQFPYDGESWSAFQQRVASAAIPEESDRNIAIFTSATPAAIWAGRALDIHDTRVLRTAGVLHNASITVLRVRAGQVRLFSMNEVPHLPRPEWRTHR